ncbi:hypothetical protein [Streptomyces sp. NPDC005549]|uniref:hypothetical protein n=1 Tax=Streptomyces sp. NPDC005549 TaxID=3154888 RepID=UPI00339E2DD3
MRHPPVIGTAVRGATARVDPALVEGEFDGLLIVGEGDLDAGLRAAVLRTILIQNGRTVREYRVDDEISLRAQINAARGDGPETDVNIY